MSGSTIGGVIGGVIGVWTGVGWQAGWMIGSAIGGYVDPTQVFGPRLKDVRGQTSAVGGAIPRAWGTAPVPGNVIWQQPDITEHENTDDGKGSGTEQVTYTYTRSYAIMFHLGEIAGVLQIKRNGKVVYDARDDDTLLAEYEAALGPLDDVDGYFNRIRLQRAMNSRWMNKCRIYKGTQTQEPDPTIESYLGIGNAPAYRGRAYMVVTDDETQAGEIAQFEIIVSVDGTVSDVTSDDYAVAGYSRFATSDFPLADDPETDYTYQVNLSGIGTHDDTTLSGALAWAVANDGRAESPTHLVGYLPGSAGPWSLSSVPMIGHGTDDDLINNRNLWLCYQWFEPEEYFDDVWIAGGVNLYTHYDGDHTTWRCDSRGYIFKFTSGSSMDYIEPMALWVNDERIVPPVDSAGINEVVVPDAPGYVINETTNAVRPLNTYSATPVSGSFLCLATESAGTSEYVHRQLGPVLLVADARNTEEYWNDRYAEAVAAGEMPSGMTYVANGAGGSSNYPRTLASAYPAIPGDSEAITPGTTTIGEIVADLCELSGLTPDEYDVSQLTDTLAGYVVARETDAVSVIDSLRPIGMFDPAEWDGKFRGIKRGGTAVASINGDDLVERDGDAFERELVQEAELLRKVTVGYLDTAANWSPNTQAWERRVGTIHARGESVVEVTAVLDADQAATVAKRKGMAAWGEPEKQKFSLPYRLAALTPTDVINYTHSDGEVYSIRLMQIEDDSGIREIESSTNCAEAYNATATGVPPKPPTITDESLRGPTDAVYMNLPSLRTQDNVPGITIAATGRLAGWTGATILMSVDNQVSYQEVTRFTVPSTMGVLTADCTASSEPISVRMTSGASLASITDAQLALRLNAFAVVTDDVSELGQFKTATATGTGTYDLTDNVRGQLGTTAASHESGDAFVMVSTAKFVPLDIGLAGRTLYFKAVTFGTSADAAEAVPFVFTPAFTTVTVEAYTDESGSPYTDEDGNIYYSLDA